MIFEGLSIVWFSFGIIDSFILDKVHKRTNGLNRFQIVVALVIIVLLGPIPYIHDKIQKIR